ncbi:LPXTG cell wall anchor domain-containing protein [Frondihabitans australicus]|uniref:LPXTG-motif cell wall-anchored protein n=1 Tax=Frondihabitans australicus TaxID=386892 RepID=A0A495IEA9_9MICO|nr:LPXTG cell wall anchor domain-containing protein [Frondihabitans australicus]RKR73336.1 LPXTG-motif cell wall-anchored protein [Frondihabitans australicus]
MITLTWRRALVAPTALALALGGALLASGPAHAAEPVFSVTSPSNTTTYDNSATPDTITYTGENLPVGDTIAVQYYIGFNPGPTAAATVTAPVVTGTAWSVSATLAESGPGTAGVQSTVTAMKDGAADPAVAPVQVNYNTTTALRPADFAVTTPTASDVQISPTVTFSGTAAADSHVQVAYAGVNGEEEGGSVDTDGTGVYSLGVDFSKLPVGATSAQVTVSDIGANADLFPGTTPITRTVTFATAPNPGNPTASVIPIVTTLDRATTTGLQLNASNFTPRETLAVSMKNAVTGAAVVITQSTAVQLADGAGALTEEITLPKGTSGYDFEVTVTGQTSHATAVAPVALLGDPTITAPTEGQALVGSTVTFSGTGTPGSNIVLVYGPTAEIKAQLEKSMAAMTREQTDSRTAPKAAAPEASSPSDPAAPAAPIVVGSDGSWSVTYTAAAGDYTAIAVGTLLDENGEILLDQDGDPIVTTPTAPVDFTLAAAAVTTSSTGQTLAFTGSDSTPIGVAGGALLVVGLGLVLAARRRRVRS